MPFSPADFRALVQGEGFTLWRYRTADARAVAAAPGYFAPVAGSLRPNDLLLLHAADALGVVGFVGSGAQVALAPSDSSTDMVKPAGAGTAARSLAASLADFVAPEMFGAKGDGAADDTAALQAALDSGRNLRLRARTYNHTGLVLKHSGQSIAGEGTHQSVLRNTTAGKPSIAVNPHVHHVALKGFRVTRSVPAAPGGHGVSFPVINAQAVLENLFSDGNHAGFHLGGTDYSTVTNCIAERNWGPGFHLFNSGAVPCQWYVSNCLSQKNNGPGLEIRSVAGGGATQTTVGDIAGFQTFANGSYGVCAFGSAAVPVHGVRLRACYLGTDANSEVFLDTHGGYHTMDGVFTELAGRDPTGRDLAAPASGLGYGFQATANNRDFTLSGCTAVGHSWSGVGTAAQTTVVSGSRCDDNGRALVDGNRAGVRQVAAAARVLVNGTACGGAGGVAQQHGVLAEDGANCAVVGCDLSGNAVETVLAAANFGKMTLVGNLPFQHKNFLPGGLMLGEPAGGAAPPGSINASGEVCRNNVAYTRP